MEGKIRTLDRGRMIGAGGAVPRTNGYPHDDGTETEHVTRLVAFVAQEQLIIIFAGPTFIAADVAVFIHHSELCPPHYILHRPVLLLPLRHHPRRRHRRPFLPPPHWQVLRHRPTSWRERAGWRHWRGGGIGIEGIVSRVNWECGGNEGWWCDGWQFFDCVFYFIVFLCLQRLQRRMEEEEGRGGEFRCREKGSRGARGLDGSDV